MILWKQILQQWIKTFLEKPSKKVSDNANDAVQKADEVQNDEEHQKEVDVAENESQQVDAIPQILRLQLMRFKKLMQLLKHHFRKLTQLLKMELIKLMKFLHNNFRRLMKLKKLLEKYLIKLTKLEAFIGERSFKSSTAKTFSKSEIDVTNIMSEVQFNKQEIVLESDVGNDPLSLKDQDMLDVAKVLATHMLSENTTTKESDEDELAGNQAGFDLNMEEFSSDFNASVLQDS